MYYKIKEMADMSGVSVRMLRHYNKIGLLNPENISPTGYRLYSENDVKKLSQILFFRELDFSLDEIKRILCSSNSYKSEILKIQQQLLAKKRDKIDALMSAIDKSIVFLEQGQDTKAPNVFTSLDLAEISRNKDKLKKDLMTHLFPDSEDECGKKTSHYSKDDWTIVMSKIDVILKKIVMRMDKGPANAEIQELIGDFKEFISNNLIKCNSETLKLLGGLYVDNRLYRKYMEQYGSSFPEFMKNAIDIYIGD